MTGVKVLLQQQPATRTQRQANLMKILIEENFYIHAGIL